MGAALLSYTYLLFRAHRANRILGFMDYPTIAIAFSLSKCLAYPFAEWKQCLFCSLYCSKYSVTGFGKAVSQRISRRPLVFTIAVRPCSSDFLWNPLWTRVYVFGTFVGNNIHTGRYTYLLKRYVRIQAWCFTMVRQRSFDIKSGTNEYAAPEIWEYGH